MTKPTAPHFLSNPTAWVLKRSMACDKIISKNKTRFENGSKLANITRSMTTPALKDCCDFYFCQYLFSFKTSKIWQGAQERYELISNRWNSISLWLMRLNYFCPILQKKNRCGILNINVLKCLPNNTPQEDKKKIK